MFHLIIAQGMLHIFTNSTLPNMRYCTMLSIHYTINSKAKDFTLLGSKSTLLGMAHDRVTKSFTVILKIIVYTNLRLRQQSIKTMETVLNFFY